MTASPAMTELPDISLLDFESASRSVLEFLHNRLGFGLWMVTRTEGDAWIVLQAEDHGYGVKRGDVMSWAESFCSSMVKGEGPRVAPDSDRIPAYATAPLGKKMPIKAYIGVPLYNRDGELFGTLCGIDPSPQPEGLSVEQPLVELLGALLSSILKLELHAADAQRQRDKLEMDAQTDSLTNLANRRAWDALLTKEEERCLRYAHSAAIIVVDLDGLKQVNDIDGQGAGDTLIERTAEALRYVMREVDVVARLGGDEFGVIAVECNDAGALALRKRLRAELDAQEIHASIGIAVRTPTGGLEAAWEMADRRMYEEKRVRMSRD